MLDFEFSLGLQVLKVIFSNTNALSRYLQGQEVDVMSAKTTCDATVLTLEKCRSDESFNLVWTKAKSINQALKDSVGDKFDLEITLSKRKKKPSKRLQAIAGESPEGDQFVSDYVEARVTVYFDALDKVMSEMNERFSDGDTQILSSCIEILRGSLSDESVKMVSEFYDIDQDFLLAESRLFHNVEGVSDLKTSNDILQFLQSNNLFTTLPHFSNLVKVFASIPATSCSAERSFSCLRCLNTYLRSTMGQARLSALGMLAIEREFVNAVSLDTVIDIFGSRKGRNKHFF